MPRSPTSQDSGNITTADTTSWYSRTLVAVTLASAVARISTVVAAQNSAANTPNASPSGTAARGLVDEGQHQSGKGKQNAGPWRQPMRSPGTKKCRPSTVKHGAVYRKTTMRETVVRSTPTKMKTNSRPNNRPASSPGRSDWSRPNNAIPRQRAQA
jgi:hypothetical protein